MNTKKYIYVFATALLLSLGLIYAAAAKNNWNNNKKVETEKIDSDSQDKNVDENLDSTKASDMDSEESSNEDILVEELSAEENSDSIEIQQEESGDNSNIDNKENKASEYPLHKNISTTYFWVGEGAGKDNKNISNVPSAWDEAWVKHFGGVDDPKKRDGFYPAGFTPKENPFYFALPYNDFDEDGKQKNDTAVLEMWGGDKKFGKEESMCKNQWIKVTKDGKSVYAQWQDVGPYGENDKNYVFGDGAPKTKENENVGLDVSPAARDYLGLDDIDKTDWQFVDAKDVPAGPWKNIVTTSQVYWK